MFTGIVETLGTIQHLHDEGAGRRLILDGSGLTDCPRIGESVAVNGVCLTVVKCDPPSLHFQIGPETLRCTNLGQLRAGDRVNLERPLRVADRLGGHFVQGHVDGIARIADRIPYQTDSPEQRWELVWFQCPSELTSQMVAKGSVAVDGVSLTLVDVERERFSVALIPHTLSVTTLGFKTVGDSVNVETDILAKYVARLLSQWQRR
ncbi:MAG: riboflavin synthase subunit alpha [Gemmatales bacterium]|nr:MAG: riboflavin synthase subunit alpha [Gemmatales bacterium]